MGYAVKHQHTVLLMADDDEDDTLLVRTALSESFPNAELRSVEDGDELMTYLHNCVESIESPCPDMILLDLNMPKKSGREALAEIKSDPQLKSIPIVILTTSKEQEDIQLCYALGANSFIVKPLSYNKLVNSMKALCAYWFNTATLPSSPEPDTFV